MRKRRADIWKVMRIRVGRMIRWRKVRSGMLTAGVLFAAGLAADSPSFALETAPTETVLSDTIDVNLLYASLLADEESLLGKFPEGDGKEGKILRFRCEDFNGDGIKDLIVSLDKPDSSYNSDTCFFTIIGDAPTLIGVQKTKPQQKVGYHAETGCMYLYTEEDEGEQRVELFSFSGEPEQELKGASEAAGYSVLKTYTMTPDEKDEVHYYVDGYEIKEKEFDTAFIQDLGKPIPFYEEKYYHGWDGYEMAADIENTETNRLAAFGSAGSVNAPKTAIEAAATEAHDSKTETAGNNEPKAGVSETSVIESGVPETIESETSDTEPVVSGTDASEPSAGIQDTSEIAVAQSVSETVLPEQAVPAWENNLLKEEHGALGELKDNGDTAPPAGEAFGVPGWNREWIQGIYVLDSLAGKPADAVDLSQAGDGSVWGWVDGQQKLYIAGEGGVKAPSDSAALFAWYSGVKVIDLGGHLHTDETTDMRFMFYHCETVQFINLQGIDTSKAETFAKMFTGCGGLTGIDLSMFDTSSVKDFYQMFHNCKLLQTLDLRNFQTSHATKMGWMFSNCESLQSIDLTPEWFDTSGVKNMSSMFSGCRNLSGIDVSWFQMGKVRTVVNMFNDCPSLPILNLYSWDLGRVEADKHDGMFLNSSLQNYYGPNGEVLFSTLISNEAGQDAPVVEGFGQDISFVPEGGITGMEYADTEEEWEAVWKAGLEVGDPLVVPGEMYADGISRLKETGYILPQSASKYLTESDVAHLSMKGCCYARNEIYARHERQFKAAELKNYFENCSWYLGNVSPDDFDDSYSRAVFNDYEYQNASFLWRYETDHGMYWPE